MNDLQRLPYNAWRHQQELQQQQQQQQLIGYKWI